MANKKIGGPYQLMAALTIKALSKATRRFSTPRRFKKPGHGLTPPLVGNVVGAGLTALAGDVPRLLAKAVSPALDFGVRNLFRFQGPHQFCTKASSF